MSQDNRNDRDQDTLPQDPRIIHVPTETEREEEQRRKYQEGRDRNDEAYKSRQLAIQEGQLRTNRRISFYTLVLAVLTALGTSVAFLNSQAAKESANAAKSAAETARDALNRSVIDNMDNRRDNWFSLNKTLGQSQTALDATIKSAHDEQRAWVGPTAISVVAKDGQVLQFEVFIVNSGKSIARKVHSSANWQVAFTKDPLITTYGKGVESVTILQPSMQIVQKTMGDVALNRGAIEGIKNQTVRAYVFGIVTYEDIFNKPHTARYCAFVDPTLNAVASCNTYNDAN